MKKRLSILGGLLRFPQWIKNFFLFVPLVFSKHLFQADFLLTESLAFFLFCLTSSSVYIFNDISDRETDKLHPVKRNRPVAAGKISIAQATAAAVLLFIAAALIGRDLSWKFQLAATLYFIINLAYSFWLKRFILIDVFVVAAGFMLRVLAGAYAIDVQASHWLVLCTLFVSLFLAISKRRGELVLTQHGVVGRSVLREYDLAFIDQTMTVAASGMAISYALYTVAERTVNMFGTENLIFTTVFVLFGIFRYLFLMKKQGIEDNPMRLLLRDPIMVSNIFAWFLACVMIIYSTELKTWMKI